MKSLTYYKEKVLAVRNACNALLAEMERETVSDRPKRKKKVDEDFAEYERALITGTRVRKPKELRKSA